MLNKANFYGFLHQMQIAWILYTVPHYRTVVNYEVSMLEATKKFFWVNHYIPQEISEKKNGFAQLDIYLLRLKGKHEKVRLQMSLLGFRPATLSEILVLPKYSEPIVALGSSVDDLGLRRVPAVSSHKEKIYLDLVDPETPSTDWYYAAIRK